ncbi:MAG: tetratricopeptide repeat protein [Pseudomonadota bacterium]
MKQTLRNLSLLLLTLLIGQQALAIGPTAQTLQKQWAVIKYQTEDDDKREKAMEQLAEEARQAVEAQPQDAEVLVWAAIVISSYAGERGGLGALGLAKESKALLERAEAIEPAVLNGSIYTSLGSLYYQVPGWPLGFGDDDKAETYLKKALAVNPDGIDSNFFWGDFLIDEGRYEEAVKALKKALDAPARSGREIADAGRREEIKEKLSLAEQRMNY